MLLVIHAFLLSLSHYESLDKIWTVVWNVWGREAWKCTAGSAIRIYETETCI